MPRQPLRLSRAEIWLLDAVSECPVAIRGLTKETICRNTNSEIADALLCLHARKFVRIEDAKWHPCSITRAKIIRELPTRWKDDGSGCFSVGPNAVYFSLSFAGGRAWEAFFKPDWDRKIQSFASGPDDSGIFAATSTCISKDSLEFSLKHELSKPHMIVIDQATVRWKRIRSWKPYYWKTFGVAHQLTFNYTIPQSWIEKEQEGFGGETLTLPGFDDWKYMGWCSRSHEK